MKKPETIAEYIQAETPEIQKILKQVLAAAKKGAPKATGQPKFNSYLLKFLESLK